MMQTTSLRTINPEFKTKQSSLRIIAVGDSLVYGYGDTEGGGWAERLRRNWMHSESNHILYNLGIRGDRTSQVTERLEQEFNNRGELRNKRPDLIILSVGVNDTPRLSKSNGKNFTHFEQFQQDINDLLDRAINLCPVMFVGMVPVDQDKMPFLKYFYFNHIDQYRYKQATQNACIERNIPYLDVFDLWMDRGENWWRSQLSDDGLHPNVQGYKSLYQDVINWQPIKDLA